MILESALSLSLALGGDVYTSHLGRAQGFKERGPCTTDGRCVAYATTYMLAGTFSSKWIEKHYGKKWGRITLGVFLVLPTAATISNIFHLSSGVKR